MKTIRIVEHAPAPGGRFDVDGPYSGEWFRNTILLPVLYEAKQSGEQVDVHLDGAPGYGSSFLEEAFGGIIRIGAFRYKDLQMLLVITAKRKLYQPYKELIDKYLRDADRQKAA